jgi:hypothetical protein
MGAEGVFDDVALGAAAGDDPCGCGGKAGAEQVNFFGEGEASGLSGASLSAELDAALAELSVGGGLEELSLEEDLEFASAASESSVALEDILELIEKNPGLKITLSFQ